MENRLADLWSIIDFANPGLLGNAAAFTRRFAVPIERHGDEDAADRLRRLTRPFVLRRLKTDRTIIADLPEKLEMEVFCTLTREQASLYQAVVDDMLGKIEESEGIERRGLVLATMTKLKQVCNHPAQLLRDGRRWRAARASWRGSRRSSRRSSPAGERALLFTQFAEFGGMLRSPCPTVRARGRCSCTAGCRRRSGTAWWRASRPTTPPRRALFVLSLKAGGTGLTLTAANHVSTSTGGGTRRSRTRRRTARSGSGRPGTCRSASSSAPERSRSGSAR